MFLISLWFVALYPNIKEFYEHCKLYFYSFPPSKHSCHIAECTFNNDKISYSYRKEKQLLCLICKWIPIFHCNTQWNYNYTSYMEFIVELVFQVETSCLFANILKHSTSVSRVAMQWFYMKGNKCHRLKTVKYFSNFAFVMISFVMISTK